MKVGLRLGSLGTGSLKKDLQRALAIGVHGVQLRVVDTEIDPRALSGSGREELVDYVESFGFELPALAGELGGFADPATMDERVNRTRAMIDLCVDLRSPHLTVEAGAIPETGSRQYDALAEAVHALSTYALERDVRLALTTGTEGVERLAEFVTRVKSEGARLNYDPANLCRRGHDPIAGVKQVGRSIAHVQARDAMRGDSNAIGLECSLTKGDAHFEKAMSVLRDCEYDGYLSVARDRDKDLAANAVEAVTWLMRQDGVEP
jgi:sugar phosphate isomerase/epimerase